MIRPRRRSTVHRSAESEGLLATVAAGPLAVAGAIESWPLLAAVAATILFVVAAAFLRGRPRAARFFAVAGVLCTAPALIAAAPASPRSALIICVALAGLAFAVTWPSATAAGVTSRSAIRRRRARARWACAALPGPVLLVILLGPPRSWLTDAALIAAMTVAATIVVVASWSARRSNEPQARRWATLVVAGSVPILAASAPSEWLYPIAIVSAAALFAIIPGRDTERATGPWWDPLVTHPARLLLTTFSVLCTIGTIALMLPGTTRSGEIAFGDAVFTAVSATCVTGLIVLDTPHDFTIFGQACILILIQLGGLGIMTISTVALHSLGRRLSMRQERLLISLHSLDDRSLKDSMRRILLLTLIFECVGALLLFPQFLAAGDDLSSASWRAVFTSVSAFCNAGFALQSDSLMPYAMRPLVLHVVAALIIAGGMAPAVVLTVFRRVPGRSADAAARIVLWMTGVLLVTATLAILALEWDRALAVLPPAMRVHAAWFQSVTLRTAGFNSIDIAQVSAPTLLIMIVFMFIGGSPGGTAGGVKTTTVAVLGLAMWSSIIGRREVVAHRRWFPATTVYRAIAIFGAGAVMWLLTVLALLITQPLAERDLVFEATSALGTVGLSTGATTALDGVGRVIIILAMFLGRVGPLTLFLMLSSEQEQSSVGYPMGRVPLT